MEWPRIQPLSLERASQLTRDPARHRLLDQLANAMTRDEIVAARSAQRAWLTANPNDFGVLEAGEDLAYAEEALAEEGREPAEPVHGEHPPERCPKCTAPAGRFTHAQHLPID